MNTLMLAGGGLIAWAALSAGAGLLIGRWINAGRETAETHAATALKTPAPGADGTPPLLSHPVPGHPPRHKGISYTVRTWNCGRIRIWNAYGAVVYRHDCRCAPPDPWDQAAERLIRDLRGGPQ